MKNYLLIMLIALTTIQLGAQVQSVCDEAAELPDGFTLDFFVIYENNSGVSIAQNQTFVLSIFADSIGGTTIYSKSTSVAPVRSSGFISLEIRQSRINSQDYFNLLDYINSNPTKEYWAQLSTSGGKIMANKQLYAVPYAQVANVLGGLGKRGASGPQGRQGAVGPAGQSNSSGPQGAQGAQGPNGEPGTFDFENNLFIMTNEEPASGTFYVDDGTNTDDGKPHLRYNLNGTWIDL